MPLKQTAIAFCSCSNLHSGTYPALFSPSACAFRLRDSSQGPAFPAACRTLPRTRGYATIHHGHDHEASRKSPRKGKPGLQWPNSTDPTPYEIFNLSKAEAYNKVRFYELVKLYHPDRQHHTSLDGIPHVTKLERYRLVVAANDLLSDPTRRRLYDLYGTGWAGQADAQTSYRMADRKWRQEPGNPSMNGTWEDWERWHSQRDGKKQEPVYMSNGGFVVVIVLAMLIGSFGQATRAGSSSAALVDMRDQKDNAIGQDMRRKHIQSMGLSRRDRVQSFLKQRESWEDTQQSGHRHLGHSDDGK